MHQRRVSIRVLLITIGVLIAVFAFVATTEAGDAGKPPAVAQPKREHVSDGVFWHKDSLGRILNDYYVELTNDCKILPFDYTTARNLIPAKVSEFNEVLSRGTAYTISYGDGLPTRVFSTTLTSDQLRPWQNRTLIFDDSNFIAGLADYMPVLDPQFGNKLRHKETCHSALKAAISTSGSYGDMLKIKSKIDKGSEQNNELSVLLGNFISPIDVLQRRPSTAISLYLALWDYYSTHSDRAKVKNYYVKGFRGALVYYGSSEASSLAMSMSQSIDVSMYISLKQQMAASYDRASSLASIKSHAVIYGDPEAGYAPQARFGELKSVDQIVSWFGELLPDTEPVDHVFLPGQVFTHHVRLDGVLPDQCQAANFDIDGGGDRVTFQEPAKRVISTRPCELAITYLPPQEIFAAGIKSQEHEFTYNIQYGKAIEGKRLLYKVKMKAPTGRDFFIQNHVPVYRPEPDAGCKALTWTVPLSTVDPSGRMVRDGSGSATGEMKPVPPCLSAGQLHPTVSISLPEKAGAVVTIHASAPHGSSFTQNMRDAESCGVDFELSVPLRSAVVGGRARVVQYTQTVHTVLYVPILIDDSTGTGGTSKPASSASPVGPAPVAPNVVPKDVPTSSGGVRQ